MTKTIADFEVPKFPGEDLVVCVGIDEITFLGDELGESISADPNSSVRVEDWC